MRVESDSCVGMMGLRERKKQRTRAALVDAALSLCNKQGFDATTVEQISAAADVSPRTFNRYFEAKEDVVVATLEEVLAASITELESRPVDGNELIALRDAYIALFTRMFTVGEPLSFDRFDQIHNVLRSSPVLTARLREFEDTKTRSLVDAVAARLGLPEDDLTARMVVAAWHSILNVAMKEWHRRTGDAEPRLECALETIRETFDAYVRVNVGLAPQTV